MDFDFNDEQREIKSTAHEFLGSRFKPKKVRELAESDSPYDDAIWKEMCELGWPGIAISEEYGGQGLGVVELIILLDMQASTDLKDDECVNLAVDIGDGRVSLGTDGAGLTWDGTTYRTIGTITSGTYGFSGTLDGGNLALANLYTRSNVTLGIESQGFSSACAFELARPDATSRS